MSALRRLKVSGLLGTCLLFLSGLAFAHAFHTSEAEADWNAKSGSLEIALCVEPFELERLLTSIHEEKIDLERTPEVDTLVSDWISASFKVSSAKGELVGLSFVGFEVSAKEAWVYFEVPLPGGLDGVQLENRVFFDLHAKQINTVLIRDGDFRQTLTFLEAQPTGKIQRKKAKEAENK